MLKLRVFNFYGTGAEDNFYFGPFLSLSSEYFVYFSRIMEAYQADVEEKRVCLIGFNESMTTPVEPKVDSLRDFSICSIRHLHN